MVSRASGEVELPEKMRSIVNAFKMVPDPMARYKQLMYFAAKLEGLEQSQKIDRNKVQARSFCFNRYAAPFAWQCEASTNRHSFPFPSQSV